MRTFVTSLGLSIVAVLVVGSLVIAGTTSASDQRGAATADVLSQTEDETEEGAAAEEAGDVVVALSPIESLLAQLRPSGEGSGLPSTQRVVLSRDPFRPVVPEPSQAGGGDGTDGGGDGTDAGGGGTDGGGDGTDGGGDGTDGNDACSGDESETVCDGVVVTLDGFADGGSAVVTVDGTTYTVDEGDEFATSFRVLSLSSPCVTLLYGDEAFSICVGVTVLK